jgi:hypothetical protein
VTTRARHFLSVVGAVAVLVVLASLIAYQFSKESRVPLVHELKQPLMLTGAGSPNIRYLLPQGTSLYYDQAFPEGFVRYKVYINVEGVKLESREATEQFWLNPLTAFPVDAENLRKLLREQPLSKDELAAILKSGSISKADIRKLLLEFSE